MTNVSQRRAAVVAKPYRDSRGFDGRIGVCANRAVITWHAPTQKKRDRMHLACNRTTTSTLDGMILAAVLCSVLTSNPVLLYSSLASIGAYSITLAMRREQQDGEAEDAGFKEHMRIRTWASVIAILVDFSLIAGSIALSLHSPEPAVYVAAVVVIASRMRALNNLVHEASHNLLFKSRRLNDAVGALCAFPVLLSMRSYREAHMKHHARLGCDDDPDLIRERTLTHNGFPVHVSWWQALSKLPRNYVVYVIGSLYLGQRREFLVRITTWAAVLALLVMVWDMSVLALLVLYWLIPFSTAYQLIKFIAEAGEHGGLYGTTSASNPLPIKTVAMTRNTMLPAPLQFLLYPHGDGLHMLHHRFPSVPGLNLSRLHLALLRSRWYDKTGFKNHCARLIGRHSLTSALVSFR